MALDAFHPVIAEWFARRFGKPTDVQVQSWPAIQSGSDVLIAAPTGSGKTLAAFLSCIDHLFKQALSGALEERTQVLYVSPLKALSNDVQKNLRQPLGEIAEAALAAGYLMPDLRVLVRTGDTPMADRQQMLRRPPHILITTPESLFILLTAEKSRRMLRDVRTVIVDEIHAVAPNRRGAHLALSLERLEALTRARPVRIGLSATQRPIDVIAHFLVGERIPTLLAGWQVTSDSYPVPRAPHLMAPCAIVDVGHRRAMDLAVEAPKDELGPVGTNAIWADVYDRVAELVQAHRTTLVFVNTRRLAERIAHHLTDRLGEEAVASHHGSLSRHLRLAAEERLKTGQTRVVVATASLELGIDVGAIELACQIGSPRSIAVCLQRVGRSGHWVGAMPKGRLFPTTRDELIECAAVVRAMRTGALDRIDIPAAPLDILSQQIVAAAATQEWREDELFELCRHAFPYRDLTREDFDAVVRMQSEGIATNRGRAQAYLHHDRINRRIRARRGARLAAITSGGAIPDTANYQVVAEPAGTVVGSVDEDFAVESLAGDIMLLGNTSWRIRGVEAGKVRVEDAHGAPPNIPFWRGEAPSRTAELSAEVAFVRSEINRRTQAEPSESSRVTPHASPITWLQSECGLDPRGAEQAVAYIREGRRVLGAVPTQETIIAERFFDESGGMQLVIHAPFGGRLNKAWGMALRKRFCLTFDFELQAAATDEGLVVSLGERHSFPLNSVFQFLSPQTVRETLEQAVLAAPMFTTRWRWNASRSLALLRFARGRKVPPQIQRMRAEDLLAAVFPDATACQDNRSGPREIPDHPLVAETLRDCLTEAMDIEGLRALLERIERAEIRCLAVETPAPSPFSHEILNANPYAFLDDAPLEERRARAVEMRRSLPPELAREVGALDPQAIASVAEEAWPVVRDADELHDALLTLGWVPASAVPEWATHVAALLQTGRAFHVEVRGAGCEMKGWVATERAGLVPLLFPESRIPSMAECRGCESFTDRAEAVRKVVQGWMESTGPTTAEELADRLWLPTQDVSTALLQLEASGQVLRGHFRAPAQVRGGEVRGSGATPLASNLEPRTTNSTAAAVEFVDRRLLARIHRRTIGTLRKEIEPVSAADFMRFLFQWQHVAPGSRVQGERGLQEVVEQLAGFEAAASAWERDLLPVRLSKYDPVDLDDLCMSGLAMWGRLSPHPKMEAAVPGTELPRSGRIVPTSVAPISLFPREDKDWLFDLASPRGGPLMAAAGSPLTGNAQRLHEALHRRGASFFSELSRQTGLLASEVEEALWELVAAGLVTADGFDNLRGLLDPRRRRAEGRERARRPRHGSGRWSLLRDVAGYPSADMPEEPPARMTRLAILPTQSAVLSPQSALPAERLARQLLRRYGVVFRELVVRESLVSAWRDLLVQYRRMELRGEVRGGRFVSGFVGEQFALPAAVESLRAKRREGDARAGQEIRLNAADPLNLVGIILPGARVPAVPSNYLVFRDGLLLRSGSVHDPLEADRPRASRSADPASVFGRRSLG
jgi:ATP-dependent Lhr-like helicase